MSADIGLEQLAGIVADELDQSRRTGAVLEPPSRRHPGFGLDHGYRVAGLLHERRLTAGATAVGVKLGLTNRALWEVLGIEAPFWAPVYDDTVVTTSDASLAGLAAPRLEPEIVVCTATELTPGSSRQEVAAALAWAALGFEVVQCRYPGWAAAPADALADLGLHARLVIGERTALTPGDADALARMEVLLERDGTEVGRGPATDALGGPVDALCWLLRLPGLDRLPAGWVVTTGTLTLPSLLVPGEHWRSSSTGPVPLAPLTVRFDP